MTRGTDGFHIAKGLSLPRDTITDTIGILAVKGAGKTYTFLVLVEEMIRQRLPVVVIDPVGVCWGLRQGVDGDPKKGLDVLLLGGRNGDVPLEATAGKVIADFVIAERRPVVLDTSAFETKADQLRFIRDFAMRLYHANREAIHVVIDEADDVAPQKPLGREEPFTLRAIEVLVRRGRARGIGVTLVTQRAAAINKGVLTQVSTLILGRTISPQDRKAVEAWIDAHATEEQHDACMASLATLPTNEKWVWSPLRDVFDRVKIRDRITFDSSATPKLGAHMAPPQLAPIDIATLKTRIAATIERAREDDPKSLRAKIKELEARLAKDTRSATTIQVEVVPKALAEAIDVVLPRLKPLEGALRRLADDVRQAGEDAGHAHHHLVVAASGAQNGAPRLGKPVVGVPAPHMNGTAKNGVAPPAVYISTPTLGEYRRVVPDAEGWSPNTSERALLNVLAARHGHATSTAQLSILSGYSHRSSTFQHAIGKLRTKGCASKGSPIFITDHGRDIAGPVEPLPTGRALVDHWIGQLGKAEGALLSAIVDAHPKELGRDRLADVSGYSVSSSTFQHAIGKIRTLDLVERGSTRLGRALAEAL